MGGQRPVALQRPLLTDEAGAAVRPRTRSRAPPTAPASRVYELFSRIAAARGKRAEVVRDELRQRYGFAAEQAFEIAGHGNLDQAVDERVPSLADREDLHRTYPRRFEITARLVHSDIDIFEFTLDRLAHQAAKSAKPSASGPLSVSTLSPPLSPDKATATAARSHALSQGNFTSRKGAHSSPFFIADRANSNKFCINGAVRSMVVLKLCERISSSTAPNQRRTRTGDRLSASINESKVISCTPACFAASISARCLAIRS
jgi:hypothetical protein